MDPADHIWQIALALGLIVALVFALGWAVRRMNVPGLKSAGDIRVVASTFLGPKERLLLVEVRGKGVLIGVNAQNISALAQFEADDGGEGFEMALAEASR